MHLTQLTSLPQMEESIGGVQQKAEDNRRSSHPVLTHCPALMRPWHLVQPLLQGGSASAPLTNQALSCRAKPGLLRTAGSHPAISCQQKCAAGITPNSKLKKASKTQLKQSYLCSQTPEAQLMDLLDVPAGTRHTLSIGKLHISFQMQTGL